MIDDTGSGTTRAMTTSKDSRVDEGDNEEPRTRLNNKPFEDVAAQWYDRLNGILEAIPLYVVITAIRHEHLT